MKKILATVLVIAMLVSAVAVTAFAAPHYEDFATELNELGLLRGTDAGFALDRAPTRAESLVMLLRLLGLEEAVAESDYEHPFTDVPNWADAYVAYAYNNDLARGTSATAFSPNATASAQVYLTFVLRALGFTDEDAGEDFQLFDIAVELGTEIGVFTTALEGPFLRDQMVAVSYLALAAEPVGGEFNTLLDSLVAAGAVEADAAAALMQRFELLRDFVAFDTEVYLNYSVEVTASVGGQTPLARFEDGTIYVYVDGEDEDPITFTYDVSAAIDEAATAPGGFAELALQVRDIERSEDGDITVYTITAADGSVISTYVAADDTPLMSTSTRTVVIEGVALTITITVEYTEFEDAVTLPADVNGEEDDEDYDDEDYEDEEDEDENGNGY